MDRIEGFQNAEIPDDGLPALSISLLIRCAEVVLDTSHLSGVDALLLS